MSNEYFDYNLTPGKVLEKKQYKEKGPLISIIMAFYNDKEYIEEAVTSVLNQTFPLFELLIIDDGSNDKESLEKLEEIEKLDNRIKVLHKKNEGAAATRDYGAEQSSKSAKYLMILDSDDVLDKTFLECAYWTLETNKNASWAYSYSVGFGHIQYLWSKWFNSEKMKKENELLITALIRKEDFFSVNGYELREKGLFEDWNFWLKMIAKGKYPVQMNYYGIWYRRKEHGSELTKAKESQKRNMEIINDTAKKITELVEAIQYPKQDYKWDGIIEKIETMILPQYEKDSKINILIIIPWMIVGGADKFNLDLIKGLDKEKFNILIISTEPKINPLRQEFEKYATIYDLTTFLDRKYWAYFVKHIIEKNNINLIMNTNSRFGYALIPFIKSCFPQIPIIDYIHMEEWYNRNGGFSRDSSAVASLIDKTLVCNDNSKQVLEKCFMRNPKELETVYIGVDEKEFDIKLIDKKKILEKYKIQNDNKYIIGFICRITEQKRPFLFLKIIEQLKQIRNDCKVVVAGDGNLFNQVKSKAKKLGLDSDIIFLGNVKETKEIYAICDITLNCSLKEGLALTSYESLSMGVPVVSCDVGGQKELINSEVGAIVPCMQKETDILDYNYKQKEIMQYVNAVNKILENLEQYKKNARKRIVNGFTIDKMVKDMAKILEETSKNPNEEKTNNGKALIGCKDLTKELINMYFQESEIEYDWLCDEHNKAHGFKTKISIKRSILKEKLWTYPIWRGFIKFLQKTGIMKIIKKILKTED